MTKAPAAPLQRRLLIVSVVPFYKAPEADHAWWLAVRLAERGVEVDILTLQGHEIPEPPPGVAVYPFLPSWTWAALPKLLVFLRSHQPHNVLLIYNAWIFDYHPMIAFLPTYLRWVVPGASLLTQYEGPHGSQPYKHGRPTRWLLRLLLWLERGHANFYHGTLLHQSKAVAVLSNSFLHKLGAHYPDLKEKTGFLPPPLFMPRFPGSCEDARASLGYGESREAELLFVFLGYLRAGKGIEFLLPAFRQVLDKGHPCRLALVGGHDALHGEGYASSIRAKIAELNLAAHVEWSGAYAFDDDLPSRYLRAADLCVLPFDEGVQLNNSSFFAALAHGTPIVTTRAAEVDPLLRHGDNLWLCPPKEDAPLAEAMERLAQDESLRRRIGEGGRRLYERWGADERILDRTLGAFTDGFCAEH